MHRRGTKVALEEQVPNLAPEIDAAQLPLSPAEGYLLSRIDGRTSCALLREIGGLPAEEVDRCLEQWLKDGVLVLSNGSIQPAGDQKDSPPPVDATSRPPTNSANANEAAGASAAGSSGGARSEPKASEVHQIDESLLLESLDLSIEAQRGILEFEPRLQGTYPEILGVPADADRKALKRAYFKLSKRFHPDRYFRREIGPYEERLNRIYKKIVEAYELLSDPMARAEIERSLAAAAHAGGAPPPPAAAPASAPPAPEETTAAEAEAEPEPEAEPTEAPAPGALRRARRRHGFSLHGRVLRERRGKAKRMFEAGMAAFADERWIEAAGSVRLAIAFDPWNEIYKENFADVQRRAHDERARQLVKEAENALELRDYPAAFRAFEEAVHYRPHDADLLFRAARLAWMTDQDLHLAKEWAAEAVELVPDSGPYRRLLGQVYKAAGLDANARRELETAVKLDPEDQEARDELRSMGGRLAAARWLGGKR